MERCIGSVARVAKVRGFGFVTLLSGGEVRVDGHPVPGRDIFFHAKDLNGVEFNDLKEGEPVTFYVIEGPRGFAAAAISRNGIPIDDAVALAPISPLAKTTVQRLQRVDDKFIKALLNNPSDLQSIHAEMFEELCATIFRSEGFSVQHISGWNQADGGVDLLAIQEIGVGIQVKIAVQCKRHRTSNKVSAAPIRSLNGILDRFGAHRGVVATTGYFTQPALEETKRHFWKIDLQDYDRITTQLQKLKL